MAKADTILESPHNKFLWSAYGSCPLYSVDEGKRIFAIPYPHIYWFRGEKLKDLNWLEYYSLISLEIHANHHQVLRSHQCTPKFFYNTPPHPGKQPELGTEGDSDNKLKQWYKTANKFAQFSLTAFWPEPSLYSATQENHYTYEWEDLVDFVTYLRENISVAINRFWLDYMTSMIHSLKTSRKNQSHSFWLQS